jgi:mRNA interferase MazF
MFEFGSIVLTRFPFTDMSGAKVRPALVVSRDNDSRTDIVLAFISSRATPHKDSLPINPSSRNGLKVASIVRFDKLATLEKRVVVGKIGDAEADFLRAARSVFLGVFGFGAP